MGEEMVSRLSLTREFGADPQTIAKWELNGWFPNVIWPSPIA
jgi:hypothetical protein